MAAIEQEIIELKAEIADYRQEYVNASPEVKKELLAVITESRRTLNALYQQQLREEGEFVPVTSTSLL